MAPVVHDESCQEINQHAVNTINEVEMGVNLLEEDEEIFKLMALFSKHKPFKTPEPESKRSTTDLPPPTVFRRTKSLADLLGQNK
jgi:hypothetical protein